jgi:transposase
MTKIGPKKRRFIYDLFRKGRSITGIAIHQRIPVNTVRYIIKNAPPRYLGKSKGSKKFSIETCDAIAELLLEYDGLGYRPMVPVVKARLGVDISVSSLSRIARMNRLKWGKERRVPGISAKNVDKRLAWALEHRNDDFNRYINSDEKIFRVGGQKYHRHEEGGRKERAVFRGAGQLHVWWAIHKLYRFKPVIIEGSLKADGYINLLKQRITHIKKRDVIFQQDNAPCHKAKKTKAFFASQKVNLLPDWPPQSPDMSPIENAWAIINRRVQAREPHNKEELTEVVLDEIKKFTQAEVAVLIDSFPRRCDAVIASRGGSTKY